MASQYKRLSHSVWLCKYHIVFCPKYRYKILEGKAEVFVRNNLYRLCGQKDQVSIEEINIQPDHVHLFIAAPPRLAPADMVQILKSISAKEVFKKFPRIRNQLWGGELWSNGYFVRAVGYKVTSFVIQRYIRYQDQEDHGKKQGKLF